MAMKKILIVDDETAIVEMLRDVLIEAGYHVIVAMDGMQATMMSVRYRPDLVLLDISMPAGGGIAVYNRLRTSPDTQKIPVIFLTAMPPSDIAEQIPSGKTVTVLQKPFKNENLLKLVKDFIQA